jgi:hypothetical protein
MELHHSSEQEAPQKVTKLFLNTPYDGLLAVTEGLPNLAHAMRQRFVGYDNIRPDRLEQLLLGQQAIWIFHEIAQQFEALATKRNLAIPGSQRVPHDIERISLELKHLERPTALPSPDGMAMKCDFSQITTFSAKLHGSVRTAATVYGNIGPARLT